MTTKVKYIADNVVTVDQIDLSTLSTSNVSEGTNLYYTDARVDSRLSSGSVATISTSGDVTVGGNLTVNGTTTTINSTTLDIDDLNITLASGAANAAAADGAGITVDGASATLTYYSTPDAWSFNKSISIDTNSPRNSAKLTVAEGKINAGTDTSVGGSVTLENYYANGVTAAWGATRSSGGAAMLYGVYPSTTAQTEFTSSTGIALNRGAYVIDDVHRFYAGSNQTVAVGSNVTMSEVMRIESDGKVGIGTSNPTYSFVVSNGGAEGLEISAAGISSNRINTIAYNRVTSSYIDMYMDAANIILMPPGGGGGNVGIGTVSPGVPLHVYNASQGRVAIENASRRFDLAVDGDGLGFRDQSAAITRMTIDTTGKVGIGTTGPVNPLHIKQSNGSHLLALETSYDSLRNGRGQISWRDSGSITGGIWTEYDGTMVSMRFGNLYNSGYNTNTSMTIRGNGNVGIGTDSPTEKLHIGSGQSNYIRIHNAASGDVSSGIQITRGSNLGLQIYDNPQDDTSTFNAEGNINFRTSGQSYRLYIKDNGNISIGTTTQTSRLNIAGPSSGSLPVFDIQTTGSGSFMRGVRMLGTQMATGNDLMYAVGSADSARNMGQMYFNYSGTSGSTDNSLRLGLHSVDHMLNLWGSGDIGIGKGTNSQDDPKPRAPFHVKKGGILFNGVGDDTQTTYDNNWTWFQCSGVSGTYSSAVRITIPDVNGSGQSLGFGSFSIEVYVSGYNGRYCHAYYSGYVNGGLSNGELATRAASSGTWTLSAGLEGTQGFYLNIAFPGSLTHPSVYVRVTKGGDTTNGRWTPLTSANINWT